MSSQAIIEAITVIIIINIIIQPPNINPQLIAVKLQRHAEIFKLTEISQNDIQMFTAISK
jgi:hypothetical protein